MMCRLTKSVIVPYEELADRSLQLENVQRTGSYLNSVLRFMRLHQQLNNHMRGSKKNITKGAAFLLAALSHSAYNI